MDDLSRNSQFYRQLGLGQVRRSRKLDLLVAIVLVCLFTSSFQGLTARPGLKFMNKNETAYEPVSEEYRAELRMGDSRETTRRRVYTCRIRGSIRILIFWLGRDDVGFGSISTMESGKGDAGLDWHESIEVLFGTEPERMPRKINRWGYGLERARWRRKGGTDQAELVHSSFTGFMRHSKEGSISEITTNEATATESGAFLYDAITTQIDTGEAVSKVYTFAESQNLTYRDLARLKQVYSERIKTQTPVRVRNISNGQGSYSSPFGFLFALRSLIDMVTAGGDQGA